ncbi:MAG: hypothetical protein AAGA55_08900 [Planctomycetota bacterium]
MNRRGAAMILVLGASVVLLTAAAVVARSRVTEEMHSNSGRALTLALNIAEAADDPILAWLRHESGDVVLPANNPAPSTSIMRSNLQIADCSVSVTVTAWDQHGMVPRDSTLADSLSSPIPNPEVSVSWLDEDDPGLDLGRANAGVFPSLTQPGRPGGLIATHNPPPGVRKGRSARIASINVHTAPIWLLDSLLSDTRGDELSRILAARRSGERADLSGIRSGAGEHIRLIGTSPAWSFRTDVRTKHASVSVWSVYTRRGGVWVREQRLVIAE